MSERETEHFLTVNMSVSITRVNKNIIIELQTETNLKKQSNGWQCAIQLIDFACAITCK